jgi:hypothetical protein
VNDAPTGVVFRRLDARPELDLAERMIGAGPGFASPPFTPDSIWFGLWQLAPAEGAGLVGVAISRQVAAGTAELCAAVSPFPGLLARLVWEVANAYRAQGAEWLVTRSMADVDALALLRGVGFRGFAGSWLRLEL